MYFNARNQFYSTFFFQSTITDATVIYKFRLTKEFFAHLQSELGQLRFSVSKTQVFLETMHLNWIFSVILIE